MEDSLAGLLARERRIAYALTDRALRVIEVGGSVPVLGELGFSAVGRSLLDLVPEFLGIEAVLADLLDGALPRLELSRLNRETLAGQTVYIDCVELPHVDRSGQIMGLVHLVQDVTETGTLEREITQRRNELHMLQGELRRRNLELAAANAELERLDELKSQFVSVAAHELRNPLAAILGYLEMLLDGDFGPLLDEQRETMGLVSGAGRRLFALTNDLLDVTRIEAGRIDLVLRPTDLATLVSRVAAEYRAQVKEKDLQLGVRAAPGLPDALCDEARAAQIVGNLIGNALKYTEPGGQISVQVIPAREAGFLEVSVSDTGIGISQQDRAELFSRFYRAENARRSVAGGTGLGLTIARSLAELHGGRIWLESEVGQGSTFHVTFVVADG